jgi:hypothetical protein
VAERRPLISKKLRICQYGSHCCVCLTTIEPGEQYYDGGYWRRAHELCAQKAELDPSMEKSRAQQRAGYAPDEPSREEPTGERCQHPGRNGKHELYASPSGYYCRACGYRETPTDV